MNYNDTARWYEDRRDDSIAYPRMFIKNRWSANDYRSPTSFGISDLSVVACPKL
jgi:hypothetical protein